VTGTIWSTIITVIAVVIALALTPVVIGAVTSAKQALGTGFPAASTLLDLVPLVYVAGCLGVAGVFLWRSFRGGA
jgi:hypothetical protein